VCPFALGLRRSSPHHSSTISNEAAFGTDYFTRTAVAKSNIFVNAPIEAKYFYQDLDASGARLRPARGSVRRAAQWRTPLHGDVPHRPRHEEQGLETRSRWRADDLRPSRPTAAGSTKQLAAGSCW
jgi:hypothetical protein